MADLVLLHGFTQTGRSWQPIAHALAGRYRAVAPDLPGHGDFAERRPASFAACDAYLRALADGRPFTLAGYSLGGRVALHAALSLGPVVERLVLIGASPGIADPAERAARAADDAALADRIEAIGIEAFVGEWGAQPLFAGMPRGVAELADEDRLRNTAPGLAAALRGLGTGVMPPLWERLGELTIPVDLVVGERDEKFRAIAERMEGALAAARLHVVDGAGHAVQLEAPDAVVELLMR
jgi:2-succinyl-6-hydroxy-2,4-cyclohexadiene-1-carboxylate synthase